MKRRYPSSNSCSSSSSSSSSCIESLKLNIEHENMKKSLHPKKPKRVRTKKILNAPQNSVTSPKSRSRSSIYRGVTRHRWSGRFEAHLWDKTTWNSIQNKKGRQIYLGAYDNEEDAGRTYDLAALKYWGTATTLNFPLETYSKEIEEMLKLSKEEYLASLRRLSSGFSRGISKYRGVARHHHNGKWEARIGNVSRNKYLYLGTYNSQEEAAVAYDIAAIKFRGPNAVTNFDINNYADKLKRIVPENEEVQIKQEDPNSFNHEKGGVMQLQQSVSKLDSIDLQGMAIMQEHVEEYDENRHHWDLFLHTSCGINSLPILHIPLHKASELHGLFDDKGFEENIECIFDDYEFKFHQDEMSASATGGECKANAKVLVVREGKTQDFSTSPPNSSFSTSTTTSDSVCTNT